MDERITPEIVKAEREMQRMTRNVVNAYSAYQMATISDGVSDEAINRRRGRWLTALTNLQTHLLYNPPQSLMLTK